MFGRRPYQPAPTETGAATAGAGGTAGLSWLMIAMIAIALLTLLGVLAIVGVTGATLGKENGNPPCINCGKINADPIAVYHDVTYGLEFEIWGPGDGSGNANLAVGDNGAAGNGVSGRVLITQLGSVYIASKSALTAIYAQPMNNFFPGIVDIPYPQYDPMDLGNRFYVACTDTTECNYRLDITTGPLSGPICTSVSYFGPSSFAVPPTLVVETNPTDASAPLINAGAVNGKIGIVRTTPTLFYWTQVLQVQNAGGIACILYDFTERSLFDIGGPPSIITIPVVLISHNDGLDIVANLPLDASMNSAVPFMSNFTIHIATSKTSTPNSDADFYFYEFNMYNGTQNYPYIVTTTATVDAYYVMVENFPAPDYNEGSQVWAFDKADLMSGAGPTLLWQYDLTDVEDPVNGGRLFRPALYNLPVLFANPYLFLLGPGPISGAHTNGCQTQFAQVGIFYGDSAGMINGNAPYLIDMPLGPICYNPNGILARQPGIAGGSLPASLQSSAQPAITGYRMVWAIAHNISAVQIVIRWFEFDLSAFSQTGVITLVQSGDLFVDAQTDLIIPSISIDEDGNIMLSFQMTGYNLFPNQAYVTRLASDPLGTMRMPPIVTAPGRNSFITGNGDGMQSTQSLVLDPVDRKTFYAFGTNPDNRGPFLGNDTFTQGWMTEAATVQVNRQGCAGCPPRYTNLVPTYTTQNLRNSGAATVATAASADSVDPSRPPVPLKW